MKVGFNGPGTLGVNAAANIQRSGYPMVVHDLVRERAAGLLAGGAAWDRSDLVQHRTKGTTR